MLCTILSQKLFKVIVFYKVSNVLAHLLWLNSVFTDLANSHAKHCLTNDCGCKNRNGPGRYRSSAGNPDKQVCYFNKPNDDVFYNSFISEQIKGDTYDNGIYFKIEKVKGKTDKENFDAKITLEDSASNVRSSELFDESKSEQNGAGTKRYGDSFEHLCRKYQKSQQDQNFVRTIMPLQKKR